MLTVHVAVADGPQGLVEDGLAGRLEVLQALHDLSCNWSLAKQILYTKQANFDGAHMQTLFC